MKNLGNNLKMKTTVGWRFKLKLLSKFIPGLTMTMFSFVTSYWITQSVTAAPPWGVCVEEAGMCINATCTDRFIDRSERYPDGDGFERRACRFITGYWTYLPGSYDDQGEMKKLWISDKCDCELVDVTFAGEYWRRNPDGRPKIGPKRGLPFKKTIRGWGKDGWE